jgi:SAM-dependent methyltransferase
MYGRSFAEIYDEWYADAFDTPAAVAALRELAGSGPALELGVGTGRLARPIAASGLRVVGIDASQEMLDQLRRHEGGESIVAVCGDMAAVAQELSRAEIKDSFSLAFCAFNTLLNLSDDDSIRQCLTQTHELLDADGYLVIEAFVPIDSDSVPLRSLTPAQVRSDAAVFIETRFDPETLVLDGQHVEVRAGSISKRPWSVILFGPDRIDAAAGLAGFSLVDRWSDWSGAEFTDSSTTHISIYAPAA